MHRREDLSVDSSTHYKNQHMMVLTWNPNTQKVEIGRSHGLASYLVQSLSEL